MVATLIIQSNPIFSVIGFESLGSQSQVLDYAQAQHIERSQRLAHAILNAYQARTNQAGKLKSAPLFILKGATMPAVHVEIGYSSNIQDRTNLLQPTFQELLVAAITDGIAAFKKAEEQGEQQVSSNE